MACRVFLFSLFSKLCQLYFFLGGGGLESNNGSLQVLLDFPRGQMPPSPTAPAWTCCRFATLLTDRVQVLQPPGPVSGGPTPNLAASVPPTPWPGSACPPPPPAPSLRGSPSRFPLPSSLPSPHPLQFPFLWVCSHSAVPARGFRIRSRPPSRHNDPPRCTAAHFPARALERSVTSRWCSDWRRRGSCRLAVACGECPSVRPPLPNRLTVCTCRCSKRPPPPSTIGGFERFLSEVSPGVGNAQALFSSPSKCLLCFWSG